MRKTKLLWSCFFFISAVWGPLAAANWFDGVVDLGVGYRTDHFDWSMQGPNGFPNPYAELNWRNLQIIDTIANVKIKSCDHIYSRTTANWGAILLGKNRYSVYGGNNRSPILSQSENAANGDWVYDAETGVGVHFGTRWTWLEVAPLVGYSFHGQKLTINDGFQTVSTTGGILGPIDSLNVKYKTTWDGPWLGTDFTIHFNPCLQGFIQAEYHWARFRGRGSWDCNSVYCNDYRDTAWGTGCVFLAGINYTTSFRWIGNWAIGLMGSYQHFTTQEGRHHVRSYSSTLLSGQQFVGALPIDVDTPLGKIRWYSYAIYLSFDTYF